jgi:hypothetical protein
MTTKTIIAAALLAIVATPALAKKPRHHAPVVHCGPVNNHFSLVDMIFSTGPAPHANGCAPAVYDGGDFVGQDPDPNVRLELRRNSANEGYHWK